ncbi:hypothetical protein CROQUDRAFT_42001 [Cronartium quercuum f. sp. fusiforme G11]|uniref:DUF6534 domain-containing protein n=1 Tax=Cronartium quercuum f. sp. fusiforme G11 TaxID=708437 RepID=A0A9P6TDR4_9BASI|nr:hypothetical protein CROQUDRAFT_42001 [Cronartium quercuum f. sp. fusiforme G11]
MPFNFETPGRSTTDEAALIYTLPGFVSFAAIIYYYAVTSFGDFQGQDVVIPEFGLHVMLSRVVVTLSQLFFTYRLYIFSNKNIPITFLSTLLALYHLGLSAVVSIRFIEAQRYSQLALLVILYLLYSAAIAGDVVITVALYMFLKHQKTQFTKTRSIINRIIMLSFQTSLFTTALAVVSIVILGHVGLGILYSLTLPAAQLYLLSVVVTLNSRAGFAKALAASSDKSIGTRSSRPTVSDFQQHNIFTGVPLEGVGVRIDRVTFTDVEASAPVSYPKFSKVRPPVTQSTEQILSTEGGSQAFEGPIHETGYPPCPATISAPVYL